MCMNFLPGKGVCVERKPTHGPVYKLLLPRTLINLIVYFRLIMLHDIITYRYIIQCVTMCLQNSEYTTGQVFDLSEKLEQSEAQLGRGSFMLGLDTHDRKSEDKLAKATRDR